MSGTAPAALEARDLYRFFHSGDDETFALRGVSLVVRPGELLAVSGPSGSGKSTLLACLAGLDEPDGGTVYCNGARLSRRDERERARIRARSIGVQLQVGNLVDHLTLGQNIALAQRLAGTVDGSVAAGVLQRTGLDDRVGARPGTLSGGELARAGLAVALANSPAVIVLDEPTGELDSERTEEVMSLVAEITGGGTAAVIVSHDARTAASADRAIELLDGAVVAER